MTPAGAIHDLGLTLFLPFIIQALFFIRANCPMIDEAEHLAGGCSYLAQKRFSFRSQAAAIHPGTSSALRLLNLQARL